MRGVITVGFVLLTACSSEGGPDAFDSPDAATDRSPDSGTVDPNAPDAAPPGDAAPDAGPDAHPDAMPGNPSQPAGPDARFLSMQGVYGDFATRELPSDGIVFTPRHELWADGEAKRRWILLPAGTQIDNTDQDRWKLPVGTRIVKEFIRDGQIVETRLLEVTASGNAYRTYIWNAERTEATLAIDGGFNVGGTAHDVPTAVECEKCHRSEPFGALGFAAVQLPGALLVQLSSAGRLRVPIASGATFGPTGTPTEVAALGYLHANCGHCHNPTGYAGEVNNQNLRLFALPRAANTEPGYTTTVGVTVQGDGQGAGKRIDPGNPGNSAIIRRMNKRGSGQMPQLATEIVHADGVAAVTAWVNSL